MLDHRLLVNPPGGGVVVVEGEVVAVVKGSIRQLVEFNIEETATVAGGAFVGETVPVNAPAGKRWQLVAVTLDAPVIAGSTGNHFWQLRWGTNNERNEVGVIRAAGTTRLYMKGNHPVSTTLEPAAPSFAQNMQSVVIDDTVTLFVRYLNGTDADQAGTRHGRLMFLEESA